MAHSNYDDYKLWGGRFETGPNELMTYFNNSLPIDKRMWSEDIFVKPDFFLILIKNFKIH